MNITVGRTALNYHLCKANINTDIDVWLSKGDKQRGAMSVGEDVIRKQYENLMKG